MTEPSGEDADDHVEPALENDQQRDRAEELDQLAGELQATDQIADALADRQSGEEEQ